MSSASISSPSAPVGDGLDRVGRGLLGRVALGALGQVALADLRRFAFARDVQPPAGQARGEAHVLAVAPDGERELIVGNDHQRDAVVLEELDADHLRRRQRVR